MTALALTSRQTMRPGWRIAVLAGIVLAGMLPWFGSPFVLHLAVLAALNILIVNGLALINLGGQLSLGHAAFVAVGAYASVLAGQHLGWSFLPAAATGVAAAALIAALLGWVILRLRGVYFVLVTFAFGELVRLALLDGASWSGGANGIAGIPAASLLGFEFDTRGRFYGLALVTALLSTAGLWWLFRRPLGHAIESVRDNAALAESTGLNVHRLQLLCFVLGCMLAALGGALQARYIGFVSPESFNTGMSVAFVIMLVIGGRQSVWGPLIGALVLTPLPELFRGAVQTQHVFYGAALILILRFLPDGLVGIARHVYRRRKEHA
ncbi:branched-chain amino acid ABC transporter permease [Bordetella genomosp. 4]|uniref:branched-chain amino acid ABC transporter permease n=1 Tax=Bordetella genomosp. 4 TaxID=463044 RepID=UPI000B9E9CCC|nr:branched-chain amino acid ABC transporter permease [Bordetella genomosp. 4]OZI51044.1 branched-chain amino acid ABC transporter permease [Bordetella genomosp. 4]